MKCKHQKIIRNQNYFCNQQFFLYNDIYSKIFLIIFRCLHVTVHSPGSSYAASGSWSPAHVPASKTAPLLSATFTFDDHIRCMAAKQRLTKGRIKARQRKMHQIARLLELPGNVGPSCPSPPITHLSSARQDMASG